MQLNYLFSFNASETKRDLIQVNKNTLYNMTAGYGFAESPGVSRNENLRDSWPGEYFIDPVKTFLIDVPYGNYSITITLGNSDTQSSTTVKVGHGRLMLDNVQTRPGQMIREKFAVHVDDGQLKLAFSGDKPCIHSLAIERAPQIPTLFLAGDSTVTDQPSGQYPYTGWGQMIGKFLTSEITVANHARSGISSKSFIDEDRLIKLWKKVRPFDFLLIQFAHNDEKDNAGGTKPFSTYQDYLKKYIDGARKLQAYPALVSPMHRRVFNERGQIKNTHGDYIDAMRQVAIEENVPYIDLASKSKQLFEQLGEQDTKKIFLWAKANEYRNFPEEVQDNTHFTEYGGIQIAKLVVACIKEAKIEPLQFYLR